MAKRKRKSLRVENVTDLRVGSYNIFITTSKKTANRFASAKSYKTFTDENFDDPNSVFIGTGFNSVDEVQANIVDLTHEFNFGTAQGRGADNLIKIKTAEPGLEVLKRLFFLFLGERVSDIKLKKLALERLGGEFIASKETLEEAFEDLARDVFSATKATKLGVDTVKANSLLNEIKRNVHGQRVYISYGIGDDLKYWCGPLQTILGRIEYNNNGKKEEVIYHFATDHVKRQFDESDESGAAETVNFKKISLPILAYDFEARKLALVSSSQSVTDLGPGQTEVISTDEPVIGGRFIKGGTIKSHVLPFTGFTPSFHDNVVKLISSYLYNLGIKNHLVVLPNLDYLLSPVMMNVIGQEAWEKYLSKIDLGGNSISDNYSLFVDATRGSTSFFDIDDTKTKKDRVEKVAKAVFLVNQFLFHGIDSKGKKVEPAAHIDLLVRFLSILGLLGNQATKPSSNSVNPELVRFSKERQTGVSGSAYVETGLYEITGDLPVELNPVTAGGGFVVGDLEGGPSLDVDREKFRTKTQSVDWTAIPIKDPFSPAATRQNEYNEADAVLNLELPIEAIEQETGVRRTAADYIGHFTEGIQKMLNKHVVDQTFSITSFWEANVDITETIKSKFGSGTFAGYVENCERDRAVSDGNPPIISDDAFFVFGEESLIRDYLYGEIYPFNKYVEESRSSAYSFTRGVPIPKKTLASFPNYFLDPFWNRIQGDIAKSFFEPGELGIVEPNRGDYKTHVAYIKERNARLDEAKSGIGTGDVTEYLMDLESTYFRKIQRSIYGELDHTPLGYFHDYDLAKERLVQGSLPDAFAFLAKDVNKSALDRLYEQNVPFLIGNARQGNVISYNFDADNFIFNQFFGTLDQIYYNMALRYVTLGGANNPLGGKMSSDEVFAGLYTTLSNLQSMGGAAGKAAFDAGFDFGDKINITQLSNDLTDILLTETVGLKRKGRQNFSSDIVSMVALFRNLFENQFKGNITCLPMYNISTTSHILKPAIVYLKSTPKIKFKSELDRSTADFFSGMYRILGFRHTISKNKAQSEFQVVKDLRSALGQEND